jgi:hypothetical protein
MNPQSPDKNAQSLVFDQRRSWLLLFWWVILPGMLPPLAFLILDLVRAMIKADMNDVAFVSLLGGWNVLPFLLLAVWGKLWLGRKSSLPMDPETYRERMIRLLSAAVPATAAGFVADYRIAQEGIQVSLYAPAAIFAIAGLSLFLGWVFIGGAQSDR